jgi:hypothetical protein
MIPPSPIAAGPKASTPAVTREPTSQTTNASATDAATEKLHESSAVEVDRHSDRFATDPGQQRTGRPIGSRPSLLTGSCSLQEAIPWQLREQPPNTRSVETEAYRASVRARPGAGPERPPPARSDVPGPHGRPGEAHQASPGQKTQERGHTANIHLTVTRATTAGGDPL